MVFLFLFISFLTVWEGEPVDVVVVFFYFFIFFFRLLFLAPLEYHWLATRKKNCLVCKGGGVDTDIISHSKKKEYFSNECASCTHAHPKEKVDKMNLILRQCLVTPWGKGVKGIFQEGFFVFCFFEIRVTTCDHTTLGWYCK